MLNAYLLTTMLSALPAEKLLGRTVATWKKKQKMIQFRLIGFQVDCFISIIKGCQDLAISIPSNQGHLFLSHQAGTQI